MVVIMVFLYLNESSTLHGKSTFPTDLKLVCYRAYSNDFDYTVKKTEILLLMMMIMTTI